MHRNFEGYADPTAGEAVSKVMREYKKKQRAVWQRRYDLMHRKKVYVASPFAGDIKSNIAHAIGNGILIYGFHFGTEGVAIPTLLSRIAAAVIIITLVLNKKQTL